MQQPTQSRPRSIFVICNHRAREDAALHEVIQNLQQQGHRIDVRTGESCEDVQQLSTEGARAGFDAVVAAGGDGTLNQVVNGVLACSERETVVGVLPYGTGNDFATVCGIPANAPADALAIITHGTPRPVDIGKVNDTYFINSVSGGFPAAATAEAPQQAKGILGGFAYLLTGISTMMSVEPSSLRVRGPELNWEGEALALLVANSRTAGGGFHVAPRALIDDGLLDLTIVPATPIEQFMALLEDWMNLESETEHEQLVTQRITDVEVAAPGGFRLNLDGEPQNSEFYRIRVADRKLPFYLPRTAPLQAAQGEATSA